MLVSQVRTDCSGTVSHTFLTDDGVTVRKASDVVQVSSQRGMFVSCDLSLELCSFTLDGWLHGGKDSAWPVINICLHILKHIHLSRLHRCVHRSVWDQR